MSWLLALGYVGALALAGLALSVRRDPRLRGRLDALVPVRVGDLPSLGVLVGRLSTSRARAAVMARLDAAGRPPSEASSLLGRKVLLAAAGLFTGLVAPGPPVSRFGLAALLGVAGYRLPDFRLARDVASARARMAAAVPDFLELIAVAVGAGLTPRLALERAGDGLTGPLSDELGRARREVALGGTWRQALRGMAVRTRLGEIRRLSVTLDRGERLGTPIAEHLRMLARDVRAERRSAEEERARRTPVLMLFPLVFLILPAFVIAAVVPAVLVATRSIP